MTFQGRYEPLAVGVDVPCAFDVLAVPGNGVLLFGEDVGYWHDEMGTGVQDILWAQARAIRRSAKHLFKRHLHAHDVENSTRYQLMSQAEASDGDCIVVTSRLSTYTRPYDFWIQEEQRRQLPTNWLEGKSNTLANFDKDHLVHRYRELCSRSSLERFVKDGLFGDVDEDAVKSTERERLLTMKRLKRLLTEPGSLYRLRFDRTDRTTRNSFWVKNTPEGPIAFLYARGQQVDGKPCSMHIEIADSTVIESLRQTFRVAWSDAAGDDPDAEVLEFVKNSISYLQAQLDPQNTERALEAADS